jgi:hypothetical protein
MVGRGAERFSADGFVHPRLISVMVAPPTA